MRYCYDMAEMEAENAPAELLLYARDIRTILSAMADDGG